MNSIDKFHLHWKEFESNINQAFRELREEKELFDVTLVCDDSQLSAHKVILSACSPFFRRVLGQNPHPHPLIYIKGVKFKELQNVLNFMYMGEVSLAQEELKYFLQVAQDLKVKGIEQKDPTAPSIVKYEKTSNMMEAPNKLNSPVDSDTSSSSSDIDKNSICQTENTNIKEESTKPVPEIKASRKKTQKSVPAKRIKNIKQQNYFKTPVSSMEADIHSDIWAETSASGDAEKQRPSKYAGKSVATAEHPKVPEQQLEIISDIEVDITQEMDIVDSSKKNPSTLNQPKSPLESDQPDVEGKFQKSKNDLQNEEAHTPYIDMGDSDSDLTIDEVEPAEMLESDLKPNNTNPVCHDTILASPRHIATPKRSMTFPFVERKTDKATPKMSEGRAIVDGKPLYTKPLERITAEGSEAPPRWQCNMCKRIFSTRVETVKHLEQGHRISKGSIYFKNKIKVV